MRTTKSARALLERGSLSPFNEEDSGLEDLDRWGRAPAGSQLFVREKTEAADGRHPPI